MSTVKTRCPFCRAMNQIPLERISEKAHCGSCKEALLDGKPVEGTVDNFTSVINSDRPVVVDFWATWCGPCQSFAPAFEQVAREKAEQVRFVKVDIEDQQLLASQYQIRSVPTLMVFKNGERVDVLNGALPKNQFSEWLSQYE